MIYSNTYVKVVDNSGGLIFFCIKIYGKRKIKTAGQFGDIIIGSLKTISLKKKKKVKSNTLYKGIIVRTKKILRSVDGIHLFFFNSGIVLLNNKKQFIGNRIFGVIPKKIIKKKGYLNLKLISLAFATL